MPEFVSNGITYYFEDTGPDGDKPLLLLLAGLASDARTWTPIQHRLGKHFRLIMPDNRGCGRTTPKDAEIDLVAMADDYAALVRSLTDGRVHILGHSMGAMIALQLVTRHRDIADRLIAAAGAVKMADPMRILWKDMASLRLAIANGDSVASLWFRLLFQWLFAPAFFGDERTVIAGAQMSVSMPHAQSAENFSRQVQALLDIDYSELIEKIDVPTLVLNGAQDRFFAGVQEDNLMLDIPGAISQTIENAGHSLYWDQPIRFAQRVLEFLRTKTV